MPLGYFLDEVAVAVSYPFLLTMMRTLILWPLSSFSAGRFARRTLDCFCRPAASGT